jgi:hypothetical protein
MMPSPTLIFRRRENWSKSGIEAGGGKVVAFANCRSTERRMKLACAEVLKNLKYEFPTQNCETFIIKVLKQLSVWVPSLVGREVVEWVKREAAITTRTKRVPRRERPRFMEMSAEDAAMEAYT